MSKIGKNIQRYRENKNVTIEELALKIRCGTKTLENYENGTNTPTIQTVMKISTALDVPASELLNENSFLK